MSNRIFRWVASGIFLLGCAAFLIWSQFGNDNPIKTNALVSMSETLERSKAFTSSEKKTFEQELRAASPAVQEAAEVHRLQKIINQAEENYHGVFEHYEFALDVAFAGLKKIPKSERDAVYQTKVFSIQDGFAFDLQTIEQTVTQTRQRLDSAIRLQDKRAHDAAMLKAYTQISDIITLQRQEAATVAPTSTTTAHLTAAQQLNDRFTASLKEGIALTSPNPEDLRHHLDDATDLIALADAMNRIEQTHTLLESAYM